MARKFVNGKFVNFDDETSKKGEVSEAEAIRKIASTADKLDRFFSLGMKVKGDKGDPGESPSVEKIIRLVLKEIRVPKDGKTPTTDEILSLIKPLIPKVENGKDADESRVISSVMSKIRMPEDGEDGQDGSPDTSEDIRNKLELLLDEERLDAKYVKNIDENVDWKKHIKKYIAKYLPDIGGLGKVFTDSSLSGSGVPGDPLKVVSVPSSNIYNEIVSGSGTSFTLSKTTAKNVRLYGYGQRLTPGAGNDYTISGRNITTINSFTAGSVLADFDY